MELYILESRVFHHQLSSGIFLCLLLWVSAGVMLAQVRKSRFYCWCSSLGNAATYAQGILGDLSAQYPLLEAEPALATSLTLHGYHL